MLDRLTQEYANQIELVKVDADKEDNFEILAQYEVQSIPTLVLLKDNEVIGKVVGAKSEPFLRDWFDNVLEKYGDK